MVQFTTQRLPNLEVHQTKPKEYVNISGLKGGQHRLVQMETTADSKLSMSWLPWMTYNATDGGADGKCQTFTTRNNKSMSECLVKLEFDTATARIPPLNSQTTAIVGRLPLPPFFNIEIIPNQLSGWLDKQTGELQLMYDASFRLRIGNWAVPGFNSQPISFCPAPSLKVKTVLTTELLQLSDNNNDDGNGSGGGIVLQGKRMDNQGYATLVGAATVPATDHQLTNILLKLPATATAQMSCRFKLPDDVYPSLPQLNHLTNNE